MMTCDITPESAGQPESTTTRAERYPQPARELLWPPEGVVSRTPSDGQGAKVSEGGGSSMPSLRLRRRHGLTAIADRKSTRLNSSHLGISYAVFCLQKKNS